MLPWGFVSEPAPNPYQPPVAAEVEPRARLPHGQATLVVILTGLLGIQAAMSGVNALGCVALNVVTPTVESEELLVSWTNHLAEAITWCYRGTLLPFGMFLVRANKNARALSEAPMQFTPASMVWWFAVPFLSLVRPYQAVKEVWRHSAPPADGVPINSSLIEWWWIAWLASTLGSGFIGFAMRGVEVVLHNFLAAFDNAISCVLCLLATRMIRQLHQRQLACR